MKNLTTAHKFLAFGMFFILVIVAVNVIDILAAPPDSKQIERAIEEMKDATLKNRPGGVLEHLSEAFETPVAPDTGSSVASVANFVRNAKVSRLEITDVKTSIDGSFATAECKMDADVDYLTMHYRLKGPVKIEFRKERATRLLIIPERKWRVVRFYPLDMSQFHSEPVG